MHSERGAKVRQFLVDSPGVVGRALPFILGGGVLGACLGVAFGSPANGFRAGVILGGALAFVRLRSRMRKGS